MSDVGTTDVMYYPSKDLCDYLDISSSTLRKWCLALEKQNYEFTRTEQNRRLFVKEDFKALEHLKELVQSRNMSLENASIIVASRFSSKRSSTGTPSVPDKKDAIPVQDVIEQLKEHIEKQEQFNLALIEKLNEQQRYINERLEQRDRLLMENLNKLNEQRQKEIKLLEEQKNKSWLSQLFGKRKS